VNIDGKYYLQDLNSTNGTYVKKQLVTWHPLDNGDHIRIADYVLVYQEIGARPLNSKIENSDSVSKTDN
jgi:pSer/pThr/pTyr-binding forkhead associated (FHA) protein